MAQQHKVSGRSTKVKKGDDGSIRVSYHWTTVVAVDAKGKIKLDSNGWRTTTTKTRMNQAANQFGLGFKVWQKAGAWFVSWRGKDLPFVDGMVLK